VSEKKKRKTTKNTSKQGNGSVEEDLFKVFVDFEYVLDILLDNWETLKPYLLKNDKEDLQQVLYGLMQKSKGIPKKVKEHSPSLLVGALAAAIAEVILRKRREANSKKTIH